MQSSSGGQLDDHQTGEEALKDNSVINSEGGTSPRPMQGAVGQYESPLGVRLEVMLEAASEGRTPLLVRLEARSEGRTLLFLQVKNTQY